MLSLSRTMIPPNEPFQVSTDQRRGVVRNQCVPISPVGRGHRQVKRKTKQFISGNKVQNRVILRCPRASRIFDLIHINFGQSGHHWHQDRGRSSIGSFSNYMELN